MLKSNVCFIFYLEKTRARGGTPLRAVLPPGPRRPHEGPRAAARLYFLLVDSRDKLSCVDTCVNNGICSGIGVSIVVYWDGVKTDARLIVVVGFNLVTLKKT